MKNSIANFLRLSLPTTLTGFFLFSQHIVNLVSLANFSTSSIPLTAMALGNVLIYMFALPIFLGMNGALDALIGKANGASNLRLSGVYLQRARVFCVFLFFPVSILFGFSGLAFNALESNREVTFEANRYVISYLPSVFLLSLIDIQRRFLAQVQHPQICMFTSFLFLLLHALLSFFFVVWLHHGVVGIGIASFITNSLMLYADIKLTSMEKVLSKATELSFFDRQIYRGFSSYFWLGLPKTATLFLVLAPFQILSLMARKCSLHDQASYLVAWSLVMLVSQVAQGFQQAQFSIIRKYLVEVSAKEALRRFWHTFLFSLLITALLITAMFSLEPLVQLVSKGLDDGDIEETVHNIYRLVVVVMGLDMVASQLYGVIQALGKEVKAIQINLVTYYVLSIPICYVLTFEKSMGLYGIWLGILIGMVNQLAMYAGIASIANWTRCRDSAVEEDQNQRTKNPVVKQLRNQRTLEMKKLVISPDFSYGYTDQEEGEDEQEEMLEEQV